MQGKGHQPAILLHSLSEIRLEDAQIRLRKSRHSDVQPSVPSSLTQEELADAKRDLRTVVSPLDGIGPPEHPKTYHDGFASGGVAPEHVEIALELLALEPDEWRVRGFPPSAVSPGQHLRSVRYRRGQNHFRQPFFEPFCLIADLSVGIHVCYSTQYGRKSVLTLPDAHWYEPMIHYGLVFFATVQKKHRELGPGRAFDEYLKKQ
ncbi:hypothetical protein JCM8547_000350 [Rhodosporidiobolus lusitaniae]